VAAEDIMIEASIETIEEKLGHPLPAGYRRFLLDCSPEDWGDFPVPSTRPTSVIQRNLAIRSNPDHYLVRVKDASGGWRLFDQPWPADWIVVGDNGGGDHWFIHRDESEPGLWFWSTRARRPRRTTATDPSRRPWPSRRDGWIGRRGPDPEAGPERTTHPLLGELAWNPRGRAPILVGDRTHRGGRPGAVPHPGAAYVTATGAELDAILESAAPVVARAVAAAPEVVEAALPDLLSMQHDYAEQGPGADEADRRRTPRVADRADPQCSLRAGRSPVELSVPRGRAVRLEHDRRRGEHGLEYQESQIF
jgi:hypothetical protein